MFVRLWRRRIATWTVDFNLLSFFPIIRRTLLALVTPELGAELPDRGQFAWKLAKLVRPAMP